MRRGLRHRLGTGHRRRLGVPAQPSPALRDVFRRLRRDSDLILMACPPAGESDAVAAVADLADGLVVVARLGAVRWGDVPAMRAALDGIPIESLGAVVVTGAAAAAAAGRAPSGRPATAY